MATSEHRSSTGKESWAACSYKTIAWQQKVRAGSKEDRMLRRISVCIPPRISERNLDIKSELAAKTESAIQEITYLDKAFGETLNSLGHLLIRTESIASSKIENISANSEDYARALFGNLSNSSAVSMVSATKALTKMIEKVSPKKGLSVSLIKDAHKILMIDNPTEKDYAGRFRDVQNWIGGSDHSPIGAIFIPPPPEYVDDLMDDLLVFANRTDLPVLAQAAIAHAQFETIHPFTDGNGRIGRALINGIFRKRGITTNVVVPLASSLVASRNEYFNLLSAYRNGEIDGLISRFVEASDIAANESAKTAVRLQKLPFEWRNNVGRIRTGSATDKLLKILIQSPVVSADDLIGKVSDHSTSVYNAIERLRTARSDLGCR
jgi:Fic family protein